MYYKKYIHFTFSFKKNLLCSIVMHLFLSQHIHWAKRASLKKALRKVTHSMPTRSNFENITPSAVRVATVFWHLVLCCDKSWTCSQGKLNLFENVNIFHKAKHSILTFVSRIFFDFLWTIFFWLVATFKNSKWLVCTVQGWNTWEFSYSSL